MSGEHLKAQARGKGSHDGATSDDGGVVACARVVAAHGIDVDSLFTDRWSIEEADAAYKEFDKQVRGKAVIEF